MCPNGPAPQILCASSYFREHGGGVERIAHGLATYLQAVAGWEVAFAAHQPGSDAPGQEIYETMPVRCWNRLEVMFGLPLMIPSPRDLWRVLARVRSADAVLVHDDVYLTNLAVIVRALFARKPVIVIKHTGVIYLKSHLLNTLQSGITALVLRPLLMRCDRVVFVTDAKRQRYDPDGRLKRALVIDNGIDIEHFRPADRDRAEGGPVTYVGRFVDKKGLDVVREMARMSPERSFRIVGWGPIDPATWGLANVTIIAHPDQSDILMAYQEASLVLFPGLSEGVPLVVFEALACGTPVLVSDRCRNDDPALMAALVHQHVEPDDVIATAIAWTAKMNEMLATSHRPEDLAEPVRARYADTACYQSYDRALKTVAGV